MVILCFERHFSKQCSVIRPKSNILAPPKIYFSPPQISGLATPLLVTYLFNGFPGTKILEQSYNLCILLQLMHTDPIENADHQYDRQLQKASVKYAKQKNDCA